MEIFCICITIFITIHVRYLCEQVKQIYVYEKMKRMVRYTDLEWFKVKLCALLTHWGRDKMAAIYQTTF